MGEHNLEEALQAQEKAVRKPPFIIIYAKLLHATNYIQYYILKSCYSTHIHNQIFTALLRAIFSNINAICEVGLILRMLG